MTCPNENLSILLFMIFARYVITFTSSCHSNIYIYIYIFFLIEFLITRVGNVKVDRCIQAGHGDGQDEDLA